MSHVCAYSGPRYGDFVSKPACSMKFFLYRDKKKEWRWRLKSKGRIIADSGEGYRRRGVCLRMVERIVSKVKDAEIEYE